ncbi:C-type lectin domain family 4 member G-like [Hippopotamus amphibius kiboko]|uniref:C-type lectin domain family 4 member G-like n=1 Tax=Hippopotamus amphibius kiboko TaxID=575201 RepID=UPI0025982A60|nr:C-type lectin domain family 4 member G-like [Hippopotamus amphibius kiboko]
MGEISLSIAREPAQQDQKPPQDDPWTFSCLAMALTLLLLVLILGAVTKGLADTGHKRDIIQGEIFRQVEAVRADNESSCEPCPKIRMAFQGSCYLFSTYKLPWFEAMDHCAKEGAQLVIINSQVEQKFLSLKEDFLYWIGLRKEYSKDICKWQDGSAPTFM